MAHRISRLLGPVQAQGADVWDGQPLIGSMLWRLFKKERQQAIEVAVAQWRDLPVGVLIDQQLPGKGFG